MKADALSHCPDFDTGNPINEHLIILPLNRFKGMPESIARTLGMQSNSTSVTVGPGAALVASLVQRVAGGDAPEEEES